MDKTQNPIENKRRVSGGFDLCVIRDTVVIIAMTFGGGVAATFIIAEFSHTAFIRFVALFSCVFLLMAFGFTFSACLAQGERWRHLIQVAFAVWLISEVASLFYLRNLSFQGFIIWAFFVASAMSLGGSLSYAFKKKSGKPVA
jgi:hypothetical protein